MSLVYCSVSHLSAKLTEKVKVSEPISRSTLFIAQQRKRFDLLKTLRSVIVFIKLLLCVQPWESQTKSSTLTTKFSQPNLKTNSSNKIIATTERHPVALQVFHKKSKRNTQNRPSILQPAHII